MTIRSEVLSCIALVFGSGVAFGESAFVTAVRHAQQVADAGQYNAAVQALENSLKEYEASSGDTRTLAIALSELGRLYTEVGRPSEARRLLIRSVELFQRQLGAGSQEAEKAMINLANVYITQRDFARAQKLLEEVLQNQTAVVDQVDATRGTIYTNLASVHLARGHWAEAEQWARKAVAVLTGETSPSPVKIAAAQHILALVKAAAGDTQGSIAEVSETITGLTRAGFANHPEIVPHLLNLASLRIQLREWPVAEISLDRALAIVEASLGATHPWRLEALKMQARVYRETGRRLDAKRAMKSAESIMSASRAPDSFDGLISVEDLIRHR